MTFYVYKITNKINQKVYIGKTYDIKHRWKKHLQTAANPKSYQTSFSYIHKSIRKYGQENFTIEPIYETEDEADCLDMEIRMIEQYQSKNSKLGYNLTNGGDGVSGYQYSPEQLKAMSERMKGKFDGENNPFFGKTHSKKTKLLMSDARKTISKENYLGEKSSQAKLTEKQIIELKNKYLNENITQIELANEYNVSRACIGSILRNKNWTNIGPEVKINKKEKIKKGWNSKLGEIKEFKYICKVCNQIFIITRREFAKQKSKHYFCSTECKDYALKMHLKFN